MYLLIDELKIKEIIKKIFLEIFVDITENDFDWFKEQKEYEDWDSFTQLNIITLTETKFNISLSIDEGLEIKSPDSLFNIVKSHLK